MMNTFQQQVFEQKFKLMEQSLTSLDSKIQQCEQCGDIETSMALEPLYRMTIQSVQHHQIWLEQHGS